MALLLQPLRVVLHQHGAAADAWQSKVRRQRAHLGGPVQRVAAEEPEPLNVINARQTLGHHALLAALGQHLAVLCHVVLDVLSNARLGLQRSNEHESGAAAPQPMSTSF